MCVENQFTDENFLQIPISFIFPIDFSTKSGFPGFPHNLQVEFLTVRWDAENKATFNNAYERKTKG